MLTGAGMRGRTTALDGLLMYWTGMRPSYDCVFWDRTRPLYISVARPIAASLRGQLWTIRRRIRVTAAPVRPRMS